ncbi:MAG: hypothetical protein V4726_11270 [Verrucomicrobiota bacterium]
MTRSISAFPAAALALAVTLSPLAAQPAAALLSDSPSPSVSAPPPAATPVPLPTPENFSAQREATATPRVIGTIAEPGNPPPLPEPLVPEAVPAPPAPPTPPIPPVEPAPPQPSRALPTPELSLPAMRIPSISLTPHSGFGSGATVAENRTPPVNDPSFVPFPSVPLKDDADSPLLTEHRFDAFFIDTFASEVAAYLSRKVPGLNIMLPMNAESIRIPTMQLKNVNLREFMAALTAASTADMANGNPGYSLSPVSGAPSILIFQQLQPIGLAGGNDSLGSAADPARIPLNPGAGGGSFGGASDQSLNQDLNRNLNQNLNRNLNQNLNRNLNQNLNRNLNRTLVPNRSHTSFFDLSSILESKALKVDDITTAIRTAWSSVEGDKMPAEGALKFHQETKLLIVTGTEEYMESASAIITLLQNRAKPSRDDKDRELVALQQQILAIQETRDRVERDRRFEEEKSRELRDALQARIAELEVELKKAGVNAGAAKPSPEGETTNRR